MKQMESKHAFPARIHHGEKSTFSIFKSPPPTDCAEQSTFGTLQDPAFDPHVFKYGVATAHSHFLLERDRQPEIETL